MIVRERSNVSVSPRKAPDWPPKSPLDALLSSPNGRRKYQHRREGRSVSPSPIKPPSFGSNSRQNLMSIASSEDEEEDEETLQLQLQAIEAKLKLKKIRQKNSKQSSASRVDSDQFQSSSRLATGAGIRKQPGRCQENYNEEIVQVPLSPTTDREPPPILKSPARVMLGIDKGIKAQNVSLKRPASSAQSNPPARGGRTLISRSASHREPGNIGNAQPESKTKSFSERIRESRAENEERREKAERLRNSRNTGFGLDHADIISSCSSHATEYQSTIVRRIESGTQSAPSGRGSKTLKTTGNSPAPPRPALLRPSTDENAYQNQESNASSSTLEAFSGLHLSKRSISHDSLTRIFANKTLYNLPKLLKEVKSPHYDPPDVEGDFVVLGIVASKSSPRDHVNGPKTTTTNDADDDAKATAKNKFMVLRLVDLKWEVDLFLFDTAFKQFWKLMPGTLIAILNPGVMPPKRGRENTGAFALKLASSEDTVLEIGIARDLGFCKSIKADGQECGSWVNAKKTEFCEFHVNLKIEKMRAGRMEINGMGRFGRSQSSRSPERHTKSKVISKTELGRRGIIPQENQGRRYDYDSRSQFYAIPADIGRSAASILDREEHDRSAFERGMSKDERARKLRAERQKEHDLAEKLGQLGSNAGGEYMRLKSRDKVGLDQPSRSASTAIVSDKTDAASLGLLGRSAADISLSPVKRKRGANSGTGEPVGWGGAFKRGLLLSPKKPDIPKGSSQKGEDDGDASPHKKRARFLLDKKGLREPGRDSFGAVGNNHAVKDGVDDDDDDDLDIV